MTATIETKATDKVGYFQELKAGMNGKIKIEDEIDIHSLVEDVHGTFKKNEFRSENVGYEIYENADGDWMSFLGDHVEINLASGESFNVWIDQIACCAEKYSLPFLGFMRDTAIEKGDSSIADFWTSVIEFRLKDHKKAEMWREILGLESDGNAEITACLDDYFVNSDDAAEEVTTSVEKNPLKEKILDLRASEKIISEKYLNLCQSLYVKIDSEYHSAVGFDDYVTKYHDTFYCREGKNYVEDTAAYRELKEIEHEWNALFKELEYFEKIEAKADILKAKIAEQKNSRKPIIDWKATFEDMQISEILDLQKNFKKFLKLGQIDLAENVFSMLKTLCRNYRAAA